VIVTICGAYRNCGDHLIGKRARALLTAFVDDDIVVVDRKSISDETYPALNRARAVMLCGGPAYQREIFPKVYPLDRQRVTSPIIPFGLGWKSPAHGSPEKFKFATEASNFIRDIHAGIEVSSARDPLTVEVVSRHGVENISMTGCPAWYDLPSFEQSYRFIEDIGSVVLSMPAIMQPGVAELATWLSGRFPKARRVLSFHHGLLPSDTPTGLQAAKDFEAFCASSAAAGWEMADLANDLPGMESLYDSADLHVGYRVHAHLFCLSRRIASILVNEDIRGVGQARALGAANLTVDDGNIEPIIATIDEHFSSRGAQISHSVEIMRDTFPVMRRFLASL
jgi:hypothetical protein